MKDDIRNVAHSVHQRLLNESRKRNQPFNAILQLYAIERFLYRIGKSDYSEKLLLKGALLLQVWKMPIVRPTMDIDVLGRLEPSEDILARVIKDCMEVTVDDDGLVFHPDTVTAETITEDADYQGVRIRFKASLGNADITLQVDVGIGDDVVPGPLWIDYPVLLDNEKPHLLAYTPESAIAEKYQTMVELDMANSRMKDFYDIRLLSNNLNFDGKSLAKAIKVTFGRRKTALPADLPTALSDRFIEDDMKQTQWKAFLRKSGLEQIDLRDTIKRLQDFLMPPTAGLVNEGNFELRWKPGEGWR